jgi:hypothetical protein
VKKKQRPFSQWSVAIKLKIPCCCDTRRDHCEKSARHPSCFHIGQVGLIIVCKLIGWGLIGVFAVVSANQPQEKKSAGKGIDPATVAAYEKLGATYGGLNQKVLL